MGFTFVHAADLHLDSPLRSLRASEPLARLLRDATFGAFRGVVDLCVQRRADFLLLAGDLFDARDRSVRARLFLRSELERLHAAGIRTFIVHGNHDPLARDAHALALPPSVKVFGPAWEEVQVHRGDQLLCRVQGISYAQEKVTTDLSAHFRRLGPEPTIGLLHCNLGERFGHHNYSPCSPADLDARGLDYWALGHVHNQSETELPGGGVAVYPGNPQGRHAQEAGPRGCVVVEVDLEAGGHRCRRTFVPVDRVRWHEVEVDIGGAEAVEALGEVAEARVAAACDAASEAEGRAFDAHAVRVTLTGAGPLHPQLAAADGLAALEDHLRQRLEARSPPVTLEWLLERTAPALDLRAIHRRGGLSAEVLDEVDRGEQVWTAELTALDAALARAGLSRLAQDDGRRQALLRRARDRAVSLLEEDGAC
jgi:DNA repair exonuclease SbcCD nuclease subunit